MDSMEKIIKAMKYLKERDEFITLRKLHEVTKLSKTTIQKYLMFLIGSGRVRRRNIGNQYIYELIE